MSEEQKINAANAKLPTKTKIAAWWILIVGAVGTTIATLCFMIWCTSMPDSQFTNTCFLPGLVIVAVGILYLLPSVLLLKRKSWAWIFAISVLTLELLFFTVFYTSSLFPCSYCRSPHYEYTPIFIIYFVPLILIIIDRKNYFAMVHQHELSKKDLEST